jgi:integrase
LKARANTYAFPDPELVGHYVRVHASGARAYVAVARDPNGKQVWHTVGAADVLKIEEARDKARRAIKRIRSGLPAAEPLPVKPDSFKAVAENWRKREVENKLRSEREITRQLKKYVYPRWQERDFVSIRRKDVVNLLDEIEDQHGSRMADAVLATIRRIANWQATRDEDYVSPFVRGMRRHNKPARQRVLNDEELRLVWRQAEANGQFGALIRLLLLTGQRREKVTKMKWEDVADGVWTIATADREKNNAGSLTLPTRLP